MSSYDRMLNKWNPPTQTQLHLMVIPRTEPESIRYEVQSILSLLSSLVVGLLHASGMY